MNLSKTLLLLTSTLVLPLAVIAAPSVKIVSPTKNPTTNGVLNASGTAVGGIAAVYYNFNGGGWTAATGTTNWTVPGLALTPGTNNFWAYALGTNAVASATNKVVVTYVVNVPLTVLTNGYGTVSPNNNGKLLQIQKVYSLSAKAGKGFGFTGWTGSITTNTAKLNFLMASNLSFTANFADITRPVCIVSFPAVKHSVSNSPITITGKCSDNVGVVAVNFQVNNGGWNPAALGVGATNWSAANVSLNPGTNAVQAYAVDAAGNKSLTNTVAFTYVVGPVTGPAPASLAGMVGDFQIEGVGSLQISFGLSTFANSSTLDESLKIGNYTYTVMSSNTAQLTTTVVVPPNGAGDNGGPFFTFTNNTTATFITGDGSNGVVTFSPAPTLVPSASSFVTVMSVDAANNTNITSMSGGAFLNQDGGGNVIGFGNYIFERFTPVVAVLQFNYTDSVNTGLVDYVELTFATTTNGAFFDNAFDALGNPQTPDLGSFNILSISNPPAGHAPLAIAGLTATVSQSGQPASHVSFGAESFSQSAPNTNNENNIVGDYTFMKTGANTAQLILLNLEPPLGDSNPTLVNLNFSSSSSSAAFIVTNGDGSVSSGSLSFAPAANLAPGVVAGKTVTAKFGSTTDTVVLKADGTFTHSSNNALLNSGLYTYSPYSPAAGMVVLSVTSGSDLGSTAYAELTFSSAGGGSLAVTSFDNLGNIDYAAVGSFTIK